MAATRMISDGLPSPGPQHAVVTHCQICWDPLSDDANLPSTRIERFCRPKCPAVFCRSCLQTHLTVAIDSAFPGVLPKVKCPVCLKAVNKARWHDHATAHALDKYGWLARAACAFRTPCCDNREYTHLPFAIDAQDDDEAAQTRPLKLVPSAKAKLPQLRQLCRLFCHHRVEAKQIVAHIEELTFYGGDELRELVFEHVLLRILDDERRATLLLSYHHKYKLLMTRCCLLAVCFNCKRKWNWHDGIHWDPMTCDEPEIALDGIVECPGCHVTVVKVEGCDSVTCPCGEHFVIQNDHDDPFTTFEERQEQEQQHQGWRIFEQRHERDQEEEEGGWRLFG